MPEVTQSRFYKPCLEILRKAGRPMKVGEIAQGIHNEYPDIPWAGYWGTLYSVLNRADKIPGAGIRHVETKPYHLYQYVGGDAFVPPVGIEASPEELFAEAETKAKSALRESLKTTLAKMNAYAFEELVNRLIVRMGFGKKHETTRRSGDGGKDGIIYGDELGLNVIYVQAKHYADGNLVGLPAVNEFIGAAKGHSGIFVTSSSFSKQALQRVAREPHLALIDGARLIDLLIRHGIGISPCRTITLQEVDADYYDQLNEEFA